MPRRSRAPLLAGLWFLGLGLLMCVGAIGAYLRDTGIERAGVRAWAHVVRKDVSRDADEGNDYRVEYTFTSADGVVRRGRGEAPKRAWQGLAPGDSLEVFYAMEQPTRNFLVQYGGVRSLGMVVLIVVVTGAIAALGAGLVWGWWRERRATAPVPPGHLR